MKVCQEVPVHSSAYHSVEKRRRVPLSTRIFTTNAGTVFYSLREAKEHLMPGGSFAAAQKVKQLEAQLAQLQVGRVWPEPYIHTVMHSVIVRI